MPDSDTLRRLAQMAKDRGVFARPDFDRHLLTVFVPWGRSETRETGERPFEVRTVTELQAVLGHLGA